MAVKIAACKCDVIICNRHLPPDTTHVLRCPVSGCYSDVSCCSTDSRPHSKPSCICASTISKIFSCSEWHCKSSNHIRALNSYPAQSFWEVSSSCVSQEIRSVLRNSEGSLSCSRKCATCSYPRPEKSIHDTSLYPFKTHFSNIYPSISRSSK